MTDKVPGNEETDFETEEVDEETVKNRNDLLIESKLNERKKRKVRFTEVDNIINTFRHYFKLGNKRKVIFFQLRRSDFAEYKYRTYKRNYKPGAITVKKNPDLLSAELEMTTLASLRDMYFKAPKILKTFEELKVQQGHKRKRIPIMKAGETKLRPPSKVFKRYLDRSRPHQLNKLFVKMARKSFGPENKGKYALQKKKREAVRNEYVMSVFNIHDDNLLTDDELYKIHRMKEREKKDKNDQKKDFDFKEVWEWDELVNRFPDFSAIQDSSTISELSIGVGKSGEELTVEIEPEKRLVKYLINWFRRESPTEENEGAKTFQFYENQYVRKHTLLHEKIRLKAAIKFLKLGKLVYPDLKCMNVLLELKNYVGNVTIDDLKRNTRTRPEVLKRPNKKLRYFIKLLKEAKELEDMFVRRDIKNKEEEEEDLQEESNKLEVLNKKKENLKSTLENNRLSKVYKEYVESCLPSPFDEMFISITNGLMKYNILISSDPEVKDYKIELILLAGRILKLILYSMRWVIDTIFRTDVPIDFTEYEEYEATENDTSADISIEDPELAIKRLVIYIIKCMHYQNVFQLNDPDECLPEPRGSIDRKQMGEMEHARTSIM